MAVAVASPALATRPTAAITGPARVVDGDTLTVGDTRIRLEGIDAPETGQTCGRGWIGSWPCGSEASRELARLIGDNPVLCEPAGTDRYRRVLARCWAGAVELNAEMVRRGFAWAFVKYSRSYVASETEARAGRVGIWQGDATPAWTYGERRWQSQAAAAPGRCAIKGNVTRNGRIYHMPWSPWYGMVRLDEARGERWFCSEDEALAAGWRPAGMR